MADEFLTVPLAFPSTPGTISPQQLARPSVPEMVNSWLDRNIRRYGGPHLYGALMGQPATDQAPARGGLLTGMAELTPGADIRDLLAGSAQFMEGGGLNALEGAGLMGGAVLGTMVPGSVSGYREAAEEIAEEVAPAGIRAYHGSPHHFDEFSMEHIGKGEGAQAYGHGLYFAESEGVAKNYRDVLNPPKYEDIPGNAKLLVEQLGEEQAVTELRRTLDGLSPQSTARTKSIIEAIESGTYKSAESPGAMYEVNIRANPEDFLDWDAPLSEQPEGVRAALEKRYKAMPGADEVLWRDHLGEEINLDAITDPVERRITERTLRKRGYGKILPRWQHELDLWGPQKAAKGEVPEESAQALREAGIPGIRYYDAGSRNLRSSEQLRQQIAAYQARVADAPTPSAKADMEAAIADLSDELRRSEQGTRNYVVFDDSLIEVLRKYGIVAPMIGAGAGLGYMQSEEEPPL